MYDGAKREKIFFWMCLVKVSGNLTRPESVQLSGFCKPYISATVRVIILKKKNRKMRTFLNYDLSNFQSNPQNLASIKSIQTGNISNNFSRNLLLWIYKKFTPKLSELRYPRRNSRSHCEVRNVVFWRSSFILKQEVFFWRSSSEVIWSRKYFFFKK